METVVMWYLGATVVLAAVLAVLTLVQLVVARAGRGRRAGLEPRPQEAECEQPLRGAA